MHIENTHGLTTGLVSVTEALDTDWTSRRDEFDLVRVIDPEPTTWPLLQRAGFAVKPAWITWISPVGPSEAAFLGRLSVNERRNIRLGMRFVAEHGIQQNVTTPLDAQTFDSFLALYDRQISTMRHGIPFARQQRMEILDQGADYLTVQALAGSILVGCCVCWLREDVSTMQIRFVATEPDTRQNRVVRAMYMQAFQTARDLGYRNVSLGSDPTLYGHIAKPGLFSFKSKLGFTPIPARMFGSDADPDEADLVLRLNALTEPSLLLSYYLPTGEAAEPITTETALRLDVLTRDPRIDISPYRATFLADIGIRNIP